MPGTGERVSARRTGSSWLLYFPKYCGEVDRGVVGTFSQEGVEGIRRCQGGLGPNPAGVDHAELSDMTVACK